MSVNRKREKTAERFADFMKEADQKTDTFRYSKKYGQNAKKADHLY